jgi:transcriptional regulator with PAS, ATPase and Fis domain
LVDAQILSLQPFLQQTAEAVATVLQLDVTIADCQLTRVAGTGKYSALVGDKLPSSSAFAEVIRTNMPYIIVDPQNNIACKRCEAREHCRETCHTAYPLSTNGQSFGVLALIGFTEEQRHRMATHSKEYLAFIEQMAKLIESAARNIHITRELRESRDQLKGVVEAVGEGIMAIDNKGKVICCNKAALEILELENTNLIGKHLRDIIPNAPILEVLKTLAPYDHKEVSIPLISKSIRYVTAATPLYGQGRIIGAVELLKRFEDATRFAYQISDSQPSRAIDHILGTSAPLQETKKLVLRTAAGSSTVLLRGESGTGKELFARAIHYHSQRRSGPFIAVNCAAIPEDLLDSELFGYDEGAFTGARKGGKPGKFELADGGTLFLDEVADCSLRLQAKLLRALDFGEIQRVGGTQTMTPDVRIIGATNKPLEDLIKHGEFREDLYYRLSVIPIYIPPLRERKTDIIPLFQSFLIKHSDPMQETGPTLSKNVCNILENYNWPGNVRELENTAQYVLHTYSGGKIESRHLPPRIRNHFTGGEPLGLKIKNTPDSTVTVSEWEREAIAEGLKHLGNTAGAKEILAEQLGMSRSTIYRKIKKYKLDK